MNNDKKNSIVTPKLSIIMTVKNAEKHIEESIESVLKQSLKDIELVIIDGESEDKTLSIIENYQKKDSRIFLYEQEKSGIGAAKNCGIEHAKGEFITFLDADDYYIDNEALEKMYNAAITENVKVCGAFRSIDIKGKIEKARLHRALLIGFPRGRMFYYENCQYDYHFHSYIYEREMIINSDARFAETSVYDDTHFFIRAMTAATRFYVVPVELYCYRLHESYAWNAKKCYEALNSLIDQLQYTSEKKLAICHYITIQRINYEYGDMFQKFIKSGDFRILSLLIKAQENIDSKLINEKCSRKIDDNIISAMDFPNNELYKMNIDGNEVVVLSSLYKMLGLVEDGKYSKSNYGFTVDDVYNSKTYKVGNAIMWIPKKVVHKLHKK